MIPLRLPFNFPYFYNNYRQKNNFIRNNYTQEFHHNAIKSDNPSIKKNSLENNSKKAENSERLNTRESSDCFFELFGLKLHFDDVLIMCILFFLYKEDVHDEELFLCLILLLIS